MKGGTGPMEGFSPEIVEIIHNLRSMQSVQESNAEKLGGRDGHGFPFEPFDSFSMNPLGFQETAMRLQLEATESFKMIRELNRHSPLFYRISDLLEKLLRQLGSVCVTKAVMEQQEGCSFPFLKDLTIDWLRERAAFNFRKCYASFMEGQASLTYNTEALSLSIRWAALDKRLIATAEKIKNIKTGKLKVDLSDPAEKLNEQNGSAPNRETKSESGEKAVSAFSSQGRALPVDRAAVRGAVLKTSAAATVPENAPSEIPAAQAVELDDPEKIPIPAAEYPADTGEAAAKSEQPEVTAAEPTDEDLNEENEENIPYVSEEMVRRMSEYYQIMPFIRQAFPEYIPAEVPELSPP